MPEPNSAKVTPKQQLYQQLAEIDDRRARIIEEIKTKRTRGLILIGASLVADAEKDSAKQSYLRTIIAKAESRNSEAIAIAAKPALEPKKSKTPSAAENEIANDPGSADPNIGN